jgi:hypothetical protein
MAVDGDEGRVRVVADGVWEKQQASRLAGDHAERQRMT